MNFKLNNKGQFKIAVVHLNKGLTLIELMLTVALLGVLLSIGVPSYSDFIERQKVKSKTNRMQSVLAGARSEAMVSGGSRVCWNTTGANIIVNGVVIEPDELVVMVDDTPALAADAFSVISEFDYSGTFTVNFNDADGCLDFNSLGGLVNGGVAFTATFCKKPANYDNAARVDIALSGRALIQEATQGC